jgi:hypothetical protein
MAGLFHAAFTLRDGVISQADARVIVLDLSEVNALEGARGHVDVPPTMGSGSYIQLKLINPRSSVRARIERTGTPVAFEIRSVWKNFWIC